MEPGAAGRAGGGLVLSDEPCPLPGSQGSRGTAQAGQGASLKSVGGREGIGIVGGAGSKSGGWKT